MLSGLNPGIHKIPRQSGGATAYWVTEGNDITESAQASDSVSLTPKTVGAFSDRTRKMLFEASYDVDA